MTSNKKIVREALGRLSDEAFSGVRCADTDRISAIAADGEAIDEALDRLIDPAMLIAEVGGVMYDIFHNLSLRDGEMTYGEQRDYALDAVIKRIGELRDE